MRKLKRIKAGAIGRSKGKVSVRHRGAGEKRFYREIDFKRNKLDIAARVESIEYDPNRSADIALLLYSDGERRYILSPEGLRVGSKIVSGEASPIEPGNSLPISKIPVGTTVHNLEIRPGKGGQVVRGAGGGAVIQGSEGNWVLVKLPSGEIRRFDKDSYATVGQVGKFELKSLRLGKAGRARHLGRRPTVRGVAMHPAGHPHGGGEGRSGIGLKYPKTVYGKPAVGRTRKKNKYSNKLIVEPRKKGPHVG